MARSNAAKVVRSSAILVSSQMGMLLFSVFYFGVIANTFSRMGMALLASFTLITNLSQYITDLGLGSTCVKRVPELLARGSKEEANFVVRSSVTLPMLSAIALAIFVFAFSPQVSLLFLKSSEYSGAVRIAAAGIITLNLFRVFSFVTTATQKFGLLSIIRLSQRIGVSILSYLIYLMCGINGYLIVLVGGYLLTGGIMLYFARGFWTEGRSRGSVREIMVYSLPYYADAGGRYLAMHGDILIVGLFLTPELLAGYYVAKRFFDILFAYVSALTDPVIPKFAEIKTKGTAAIRNGFVLSSRYLTFALIPVGFLVGALSYPILQIYGGDRYLSFYPVLSFISIAGVLYGFFSLYGGTLYILGKPLAQFYRNSFAGVTNLLLCLALVAPFGPLGIAISKCLSLFGATIFCAWLLRRVIYLEMDRGVLKRTLINSGVMAGIIVIGQLFYYNLLAVPLYGLIGGGVYLFLFFKIINGKDIELFGTILPQKALSFLKLWF